MNWRLHLTNQAIPYLDILEGQPVLLGAWSRHDRIAFYELKTGTSAGEMTLLVPTPQSREAPEWQSFLADLKAPNGAFLSQFSTPQSDVYLTDDGRMRLVHQQGSTDLYLDDSGTELKLDVSEAESFRAVALDRFLGLTAALDETGKLHLYQQHIRVGAFDLGLAVEADTRLFLSISRGGSAIFVSDGRRLLVTDSSGRVRKQVDTHYFVGAMACSPDGRYLIASDGDTGVLRVYDGADLTPLYQRFAIDLLAKATQLQLMADLPPFMVGLSALNIGRRGEVVFAMSGIVCASHIENMDALPRAQSLF